MPRVRREKLPRPLFRHLIDRAHEREISTEQLELLFDWLETEPEVSDGKWFNLERAVGPTKHTKHTKHTKPKGVIKQALFTHPVNAAPGSPHLPFVYLVYFVG